MKVALSAGIILFFWVMTTTIAGLTASFVIFGGRYRRAIQSGFA